MIPACLGDFLHALVINVVLEPTITLCEAVNTLPMNFESWFSGWSCFTKKQTTGYIARPSNFFLQYEAICISYMQIYANIYRCLPVSPGQTVWNELKQMGPLQSKNQKTSSSIEQPWKTNLKSISEYMPSDHRNHTIHIHGRNNVLPTT